MLTLTARVSNTGTGASPETTLRWYLSTDSAIETTDTPEGDGDVGGLEAGANTTLTNMVTAPMTAGTYHYGACVDAVTDEGDISNNCSSGVAVVVTALAPDPELTVINMRASETSAAPSAMLTLTATVGNTGIRSSPATTLRWYLSTDGTIETTDTPAGDGTVIGLESAASVTLTNMVTAPMTAGTHYYGACVDAVPEESDTANNCSSAVAVVVAVPTADPELTVTNIRASETSLAPSGMLTLTATVVNTGGVSPGTTLRWYLSTDGTIETTDTPAGDGAVGSLEAGASATLTNTVTVSGTAGTHYYGACVDAVPEESDPANNCSSAVAVVVAVPTADPELTVINMRASETSLAPSGMLTLTATVVNTGGVSPGTTLRWYLSTDGTIETTDTPAGTEAVGSLEAGASATLTNTVTVSGTVGTYHYGACVDAVAEESDTANNCSSAVAVVVAVPPPPPELIVTNMVASHALAAPSGMLTLTATVVNNGGVSPATTLRWYLSTDGTIGTTDTAAGTGAVGTLEAEASTTLMGTVTASMTAGTYHYGACVDAVAEESDTANNCSSGVRVVVSTPSAGARLEAFEFNLAAGNTAPQGIWSDGTTLWVLDTSDEKLYAYDLASKAHVPAKDLTLAAGNTEPRGLWSDGTTMWVVDSPSSGTRKLYAYALASGDYLPVKDLILAAGNSTPTGLWSDGTTFWVGNDDPFDARLYAYSLVSKTRIPAQDFTLTARSNLLPTGIWSDGTTMWVADNGTNTEQLYAYKMSDRTSDSTKDFTTLRAAGNDRLFWHLVRRRHHVGRR